MSRFLFVREESERFGEFWWSVSMVDMKDTAMVESANGALWSSCAGVLGEKIKGRCRAKRRVRSTVHFYTATVHVVVYRFASFVSARDAQPLARMSV